MSTPIGYDESPRMAILIKFSNNFPNWPQQSYSSEIYNPNLTLSFIISIQRFSHASETIILSSEDQHINSNQSPMLRYHNPPSFNNHQFAKRDDDLLQIFTKNISSHFSYTSEFIILISFTKTIEEIKKKNKDDIIHSSQSNYQLSPSVGQESYNQNIDFLQGITIDPMIMNSENITLKYLWCYWSSFG